MIRNFYPSIVLDISLLSWSGADASCGTAACPLDINGLESFDDSASGPRLQFSYERIDQNQPRHGTEDVNFQQLRRPDHDEIETVNRNLSLQASYPLDEHWEMGVTLPILHRRHSHVSVADHDHDDDHGESEEVDDHSGIDHWNFTSVGDVVVRTDVRPFDRSVTDLRIGIGLRLPTGSTNVRSSEGLLAEPALQPGTGALGVVIDVGYHGRLNTAGRDLRWFVSSLGRWNRAGDHDYRLGAEWTTHLGLRLPLHERVGWLTQIVGRWRDGDDAGTSGELVDATGGTALFISPGLSIRIVPGLSFDGYWQIPAYENVNGVQLTADRNLRLGFNYEIPLWD